MILSHYYRAIARWSAVLLLAVAAQVSSAQTLPDLTQLFEKNQPSVVSITVLGKERPNPFNDFSFPPGSPFEEFFRRPPTDRPSGSGSGFILEADGLIATNAHVIADADQITVHLADGRKLPAKLLGSDTRSDVAILKIDAKDLPTVTIGDSDKLKVAQWVMAIGSPFGFDYTATQGIISSLGRNLPSDSYTPFIQTDVAVNPGNSGGPLFNLEGQVIGINSQIYSRTGSYSGISFAIPINLAMDVIEQLKTGGTVARGWLGVSIQAIDPDLAQSFGLEKDKGALVAQVMDDSPAAKASLQAGDIILEFNGQKIDTSRALPNIVGQTKPGQTVDLKVFREGKEQTLPITIEQLPDDLNAVSGRGQDSFSQGSARNPLKIQVQASTNGVVVSALEDGPAARAGVQEGDIILQLNGKKVSNIEDFKKVISQLPKKRVIPILVQRGNGSLFMAITLP